MADEQYDVAIVGGSIAGCTAARLYGMAGARVAVLEKSPKPETYKTCCTHFILASARPTIERIGLAERLEAAGAVANAGNTWTRYGWMRTAPDPDYGHGYSIRREKLDPLVRGLAEETHGVDLLLGHAVRELLREGDGTVTGVVASGPGLPRREIRARLVVGADGRGSTTARLAGVPGRVKPHNRFAYLAHYRDLPLATGDEAQMWMFDPDVAYAFPNDDGVTVLAVMPHKDRLPAFKQDVEGSFERFFDGLPEGPDLSRATRVSKVVGRVDLPNVLRPAAANGVAFAGDAALAADPLWGVGCGWAFQSAEWLADATARAVMGAEPLAPALARYRRIHRRRLLFDHLMLADYATGRPFNAVERTLFAAAARDERIAHGIHAMVNRTQPTYRVLPPLVRRAVATNVRAKVAA
jgi:flavin-dependent dehydrogenase